MKLTSRLRRIALLTVTAWFCGLAWGFAGPIIDFEGVTPPGTPTGHNVTPYTEDGFTLTSSGAAAVFHNGIFNNTALWNQNGNTSSIFGWCTQSCAGAPYVLTLTGSRPFSVYSIDFGGLYPGDDPGPIVFTGMLTGGGTVVHTVDPTAAFSTFVFAGLTHLTSIAIESAGDGRDPAMDNIVLQVVPEPDVLALLGVGALALYAARLRIPLAS